MVTIFVSTFFSRVLLINILTFLAFQYDRWLYFSLATLEAANPGTGAGITDDVSLPLSFPGLAALLLGTLCQYPGGPTCTICCVCLDT